MIATEVMSDTFTKFHIGGACVLHRFTGPDEGPPHDHPWSFRTTILSGGYVEEVYAMDGSFETVERLPGTSHSVAARDIHRIVKLLGPDCWTLVEPGAVERTSCFWYFEPGKASYRPWNQTEFTVSDIGRVA